MAVAYESHSREACKSALDACTAASSAACAAMAVAAIAATASRSRVLDHVIPEFVRHTCIRQHCICKTGCWGTNQEWHPGTATASRSRVLDHVIPECLQVCGKKCEPERGQRGRGRKQRRLR